MKKKLKYALYTIIPAICLIVGVGLLCIKPYQQHLMKEQAKTIQTELKTMTPKSIQKAEEKPATYHYEDVSSVSLESILKANQDASKVPMIGEIAIPDLDLNLPITKGVNDTNLLYGAATLKPNQQMGIGNYALASHYSDAENETLLFSPLLRAKTGMNVYLTDLLSIYVYEITDIWVVDPTAVEVLDETGENIITLVTCNSMNAEKRRVVRGQLRELVPVRQASEEMKAIFQSEIKTY